ncbi:hypothetical protein KM043_002892 [Ampulex compressa]|nr:hypothetical protein KM043_002892 [Ampulex compressa]
MKAFCLLLLCAAVCAEIKSKETSEDAAAFAKEFKRSATEAKKQLAESMSMFEAEISDLLKASVEMDTSLGVPPLVFYSDDPTKPVPEENDNVETIHDIGSENSAERMSVAARRRRSAESLTREDTDGTTIQLKELGLEITVRRIPVEGDKNAAGNEKHARKRREISWPLLLQPLRFTDNKPARPAAQVSSETNVPAGNGTRQQNSGVQSSEGVAPAKGSDSPKVPVYPPTQRKHHSGNDIETNSNLLEDIHDSQIPMLSPVYSQYYPLLHSGVRSNPTEDSRHPHVRPQSSRHRQGGFTKPHPFVLPPLDVFEELDKNWLKSILSDSLFKLLPKSYEHETKFGYNCICTKKPSEDEGKDQETGGSGSVSQSDKKEETKVEQVSVEPSKNTEEFPTQSPLELFTADTTAKTSATAGAVVGATISSANSQEHDDSDAESSTIRIGDMVFPRFGNSI